MSRARSRDLDQVGRGFRAWLRHQRAAAPTLTQLSRPESGLANETVVVGVRWPDGSSERVVLRLPPVDASFPDTDLGTQAAVHEAVADGGLPAPSPTVFEPDERWVGAPFLAMPFIDGRIPSQVPAFDDWIASARPEEQQRLGDELIGVLAGIHRIDWDGLGLGGVLRGAGGNLADEVAWWERYVEWAADGAPPLAPLARSLAWCRHTLPTHEPPRSLLWGDARLGNLVFDGHFRVAGILDWETTSIGPAEMDVAWCVALDDLQQQLLGQPVPGMPERGELVERHQQRLGRELHALDWHEIFALVRALAISNRQARVVQAAGREPDLPADESHPLVGALERAIDAVEG